MRYVSSRRSTIGSEPSVFCSARKFRPQNEFLRVAESRDKVETS